MLKQDKFNWMSGKSTHRDVKVDRLMKLVFVRNIDRYISVCWPIPDLLLFPSFLVGLPINCISRFHLELSPTNEKLTGLSKITLRSSKLFAKHHKFLTLTCKAWSLRSLASRMRCSTSFTVRSIRAAISLSSNFSWSTLFPSRRLVASCKRRFAINWKKFLWYGLQLLRNEILNPFLWY